MSSGYPLVPPTIKTSEKSNAAVDGSREAVGDLRTTSDRETIDSPAASIVPEVRDHVPNLPHSTFTKRQKTIITILVSLASVFSPISATIYVPALPTIAKDLHVSISLINLSVTSYMIFQGLSPSLWGSLTDVLGRRPVYLITFVVYIGACLGLAFTTNYAELIVLRCLQSTGSASTIAIGAGVIGDITQRRERGGYIGFFSAGALVGTALGPILGGIFAQTIGWHGIFYFLTASAGAYASVLFFVLPETLRSIVGNGSLKPEHNYLSMPVFDWLTPAGSSDPDERHPRPQRKHIDFLGPLKMMAQADVFCMLIFTAIYYAVWQASLVASSALFESIYHLDELSVGLSFIANGAGSILASLIIGKVLNYDYRQAQGREKTQEILESADASPVGATATSPIGVVAGQDMSRVETAARQVIHIEHARLCRVPYMAILFLCSLLAYGWCIMARTTVALPIIWTFFTGFTVTAIMSVVSTLIVDWYPDSGASATAALNLARCLLGAGGTAVVQPMIHRFGIGWTSTVGAALAVLAIPFGVLVYVRGEHWRHEREYKIQRRSEDIVKREALRL